MFHRTPNFYPICHIGEGRLIRPFIRTAAPLPLHDKNTPRITLE
jgi:hypothetical protein